PQDVAVGATAAGARGWKRLAVTWVPQREGTLGIVAFQVMSRGTSHFNIDDVEVGALTAIQRGAVASTNAPRYETIVPATSSSKVGGGHTGEWAAGGAAAGLVIGAAAVGAAGAARRRRDKPRPDQETLF
ncbi:MAG: hypothetical protein JWR37_3932, partial [Mycobacterium sp.]|nr:hypothetical protein [Mycobacterium sp.]